MPYTINPHIHKVRAQAGQLVKQYGWSMSAAAIHVEAIWYQLQREVNRRQS